MEVTDAWVEFHLKDAKWVAETRKRLNSLGWFMKRLKEPLARMANREDNCKGTFFESRYKAACARVNRQPDTHKVHVPRPLARSWLSLIVFPSIAQSDDERQSVADDLTETSKNILGH